MRDIKFRFRCHSIEHPSRDYFEYVTLDELKNIGLLTINDIEFEIIGDDEYTGLKDKNNKEIYEGDILTDGEFIAEVAWGIGKAGFILTGGQHSMAMAEGIFEQIVNTCEVIGNLYENPELIENKIAA